MSTISLAAFAAALAACPGTHIDPPPPTVPPMSVHGAPLPANVTACSTYNDTKDGQRCRFYDLSAKAF
ncbi:MAG: hypothetical protein JST92_04970, partial [Deltaproteobacteria bacterium]|nr:hypothetical protein [Deltaproteobacteria bacterium]